MSKRHPHVLIVDDDANMAGTVGDILAAKGFEPACALTGAEGLSRAAEQRFDVALIDLRLGDMSGMDVLRGIKSGSPGTECILLTGHATQRSAIDAIQVGAFGYFQKPFDMEQVLLSIQRAVEKHAAEESLHKSEQRYRGLFEDSPIAIWEEDFSEVKRHIDRLKEQGVVDFGRYFESNPDAVRELIPKIKIISVNHAAVKMFRAESKEALIASTDEIPSRGELGNNHKDFIAIAEGRTSNGWEGSDETLEGEPIEISLSWSVVPGYEDDYSRVIVTTLDVTERKQAEEALRKSESLLSEAQRIGKIGHWEWSAPNEELTCSDELLNILEIPRDGTKVTQKAIGALMHPEDLERIKVLDREIFSRKLDIDYEYRIILPGERLRWLYQQAKIFYGEDGRPLRMVGVIQDITERKAVDEAFHKSDAQYRLLANNISDVIWILDLEAMRFTYVSPSVEQLRGFTAVEAVAQGLSESLTPPSAAFVQSVVPDRLAKAKRGINASYTDEMEQPCKDGSTVWTESNTHFHFNSKSGHWEVYGVSRNITGRRKTEEALRRNEERYRLLFENAPVGIFSADPQGRIIEINPSALQILGSPSAEATRAINLLTFPLLVKTGFSANFKQCVESRQPVFAEQFYTSKWGKAIHAQYRMTPILDMNGRITTVQVIIEEITERKQAEANLLRLNRLYATFSEINQTIVRARDQQTLFEDICRVTVQFGQFRMAWIGLIQSGGQPIEPVAFAGEELGYLKHVQETYSEENFGRGPTGTAIREARCVICQDISASPLTAPWQDQALSRGYRSSASLPIFQQDQVIGALTVYANETNGFDQEDEKLLNEIGKNISFALNMIHIESQRRQAEEDIQQRVMELELLYESGLAFSQLLNPKEIAQKIIHLLEQKMDWHHTAIHSYNPETGTLELLAFNQSNLTSEEEHRLLEEKVKGSVVRTNQGVSGWAIQHGLTVRSADLLKDERYFETLSGMQSGLYVPIKLGERVLGVISIESERPNAFSAADERLTSTLANQAASAFENARLFNESRLHIMELTALQGTGQKLLVARLNPEQIFAAIHQAVEQTMPCDTFVIVMEDDDGGDYHAVYSFDKGERYPVRRLPRGSGLSGRIISAGQPLIIQDAAVAHMDSTRFGSPDASRSVLAVPLRQGDKVIGMLSAQAYHPHAYDEPQRVLLETIGAQLSSALDSTNLYQQIQERFKELETLYAVSSSLRTVQTVETALSTLLDNTLSALQTDAGTIMLYRPLHNELRDSVARGWFTQLASVPIKFGEGVAGSVCETGKPYHAVEFVRESLPHASTRSVIPAGWGGVCLPIRTSTEVIGVMFVSVQLPRQINSQQMKLLESVTELAGTAIQRIRLYNETARRAEEFAALYETSKALAAEYDLDSLLEVIVSRTKAMLGSSTSGMYLYDAETQELALTMDTSPEMPKGVRLRLGEGVAGRVAQSRLPLRIDDYSTWEGRSLHYENHTIHAVVEVPMLYAGELIGVLAADETGNSLRKFTDADERILSLFASQAAGAINSARQREATIRHAEELEQRVIERTVEIESTRKRLDLAAKAGGIGVWEVDLVENKIFWDKRMHFIEGTDAANFDNSLEFWWRGVHPEDLLQTKRHFAEALQKTGIFSDEHRIIHSDGSLRHISLNGIVLSDEKYNPERMIGVAVDITDRKRAEETLQRANYEMERALRTKDEFLANMSHELRTPLNAILGISESLEEQFVGSLNEKQLKYTGIIRESGRHLLALINDILDISKIEAGRMELELHELSIEKICQSSLRMVKELAQKKNLTVSCKVKGGAKTLLGDERRLKQALVNLLGNAVKFTPQGGAIGLDVCGHADVNEVTFTVWDEGVGIAQENIQYLFKPFVQLDAGLAREYQGTGLGLALVAQMIRLHGGHVHVESVLGAGSRFIITLPWMREQQNVHEKRVTAELTRPSLKPNGRRGGKILLVEDTNVVVTLMSEYLTYKGYKMVIARNGLEGVQLAREEYPDLILMDVMMPVMDGLEATRQIRADQSLKNIPIIGLTALAMAGDREYCIAAGMNDYMSKPIKMQDLSDMIEKYIGKNKPASKGLVN
jgi:PAS domain S-box-containing protein